METFSDTNKTKGMSKIERGLYMLAILILSFSLIREAVNSTKYENDVMNLLIENEQLKKDVLDDSSKIYSMDVQLADAAIIMETQKETIEMLELRKPTEVVKWKTKTVIKTEIPLNEPVAFDSSMYLPLPQKVSDYNRWYILDGEITERGVLRIDSLVNYANFSYAVGDTLRRGLFNRVLGKRDKVVRLHIDNPYIDVQGMDNIYLRQTKKWYETTAFQVGAGFLLGITFMNVTK